MATFLIPLAAFVILAGDAPGGLGVAHEEDFHPGEGSSGGRFTSSRATTTSDRLAAVARSG